MIYLLTAEKDDNGTWLVTCPAFPEVTTFAESKDEIEAYGLAAVEEAIAARIAGGNDVPSGVTQQRAARHDGYAVHLPLASALKVGLFKTMQEEKVTRADLMRRLSWNRESVDRLFRLDHASKTDQIEKAFHALNRKVDVRISADA